jgi:amino acid transporter
MIAISYFIVPTVIFLVLVKLNTKRNWLTAKSYDKVEYWTKNNKPVDKAIFWFAVFVFFVFWWVMIPLMLLAFGVYQLIQWITNGKGVVPISNEQSKNRSES